MGRLSAAHPLAALLDAAAAGTFPPADVEDDGAARGPPRRRAGATLFAQTAPANVPSLKALLTAGFAPIAGEVLFFA